MFALKITTAESENFLLRKQVAGEVQHEQELEQGALVKEQGAAQQDQDGFGLQNGLGVRAVLQLLDASCERLGASARTVTSEPKPEA